MIDKLGTPLPQSECYIIKKIEFAKDFLYDGEFFYARCYNKTVSRNIHYKDDALDKIINKAISFNFHVFNTNTNIQEYDKQRVENIEYFTNRYKGSMTKLFLLNKENLASEPIEIDLGVITDPSDIEFKDFEYKISQAKYDACLLLIKTLKRYDEAINPTTISK